MSYPVCGQDLFVIAVLLLYCFIVWLVQCMSEVNFIFAEFCAIEVVFCL